jgi:hypothetical protein
MNTTILSFSKYTMSSHDSKIINSKLNTPENRYRTLFGNTEIKFYYNGLADYID